MTMASLNYVVLLLSISYSTAFENGDLEKYGPFQFILNNILKCNHDKNFNLNVSKIQVYFYDFQNNITRNFPVKEAARGILSIPHFDKKKKIFIHVSGYKSSVKGDNESRVRKTFKKVPNSYLIIVDHSYYTNSKNGLKSGYERSVKHIYYIGKQLAKTLTELYQAGVSSKNFHCIGHSLGSQILGYTGQYFTNATGQKVWRITALDPAGPCFQDGPVEIQIRSGAAEHVEVYHCNKRSFGTTSELGDVNFYVNNGKFQPDCGTFIIPGFYFSAKAAECSHKKCVAVWLASVTHKRRYQAFECDRYKNFKNNKCLNNKKTTAGLWNPGTATGKYYFSSVHYKLD